MVIGDLTKLQQHHKVFVPGTVLETQDFKLVVPVLTICQVVDLCLPEHPVLSSPPPLHHLAHPLHPGQTIPGTQQHLFPSQSEHTNVGIDHLQPLVTYGSGGQPLWKAWVVNSEGEAEAEEQGARSA